MWVHFNVHFHDGQELHKSAMALWVPSLVAGLPEKMHLRVDIKRNAATGQFTCSVTMNREQNAGDHLSIDVVEEA